MMDKIGFGARKSLIWINLVGRLRRFLARLEAQIIRRLAG
jgi:hypothetical protein